MARYIEDVDFSTKATEGECGAHIAYTFDFQGGAASGYNTPLLFKGKDKESLSFTKIEKLKSLGEDVTEITKTYVSQLMDSLTEALKDKYSDGWSWIWVADADFDNNVVIFSVEDGLYSTSFEVNGIQVTVGDTAESVLAVTDYQVVEDDILVSIDFFENIIDQTLSNLVKSAIKHSEVKSLLIKAKNSVIAETNPADLSSANTNINKGDFPLDKEEFLKSAEFQELVKAQVSQAVTKAQLEAEALAKVEIEKARTELEALRKAEQDRITNDYMTVIKGYGLVEEDKVELLVKHLVENKEVAELIVEAFEKAAHEVETVKAEFSKELGVNPENSEAPIKNSSDLIAKRAQEMKARKTK